jgi:osmotically-inducible protein OsmY
MSEWYRRDREQERGRQGDRDRNERDTGGEGRWSGGSRNNDDQRSFGGRDYDDDYRGNQDYQTGGRQGSGSYGYGGEDYGRSGQGYGGGSYGGQSGGGQGYGEGQQYGAGRSYGGATQGGGGQAYGEGRQYSQGGGGQSSGASQSYGGGQQYGGGQYGGQQGGSQYGGQQGYGQSGASGQNERLQRVSDGEAERGRFFGGGMSRGTGEHRGRGPKNYTRSDDRIREDVNDRLGDDSWLDASEIDVQVSSCEVTLTGTVNSREDKRRAEDVAEQVSGVKHVQNNLRIQSSASGAQSGTQGQNTGMSGVSSDRQGASTTGSRGSSGVQ